MTVASSDSAGKTRKRVRVLMVDGDPDHPRTIEQDFSQAGASLTVVSSLASAREILCQTRLDVVILDIFLPDGRGESLLPNLEACARQPGVIIASAFLGQLELSALEYRPALLSKPFETSRLLEMVSTVARSYSQRATERFVRRFHLSRREAEAVMLITRGLKAKEIADRMFCSEKTVYSHLLNTCAKTGCHDYHEVVSKLLAFVCHELGHTQSDCAAVIDENALRDRPRSVTRAKIT